MPTTDPTAAPTFRRHEEAMVADLLSGMLVWGGIGWVLDAYVLHTRPWGLVLGVVLGFALGTYLLYLRTEGFDRREEDGRVRP
jgi:F0F1-type ATP synthase assembly protein I